MASTETATAVPSRDGGDENDDSEAAPLSQSSSFSSVVLADETAADAPKTATQQRGPLHLEPLSLEQVAADHQYHDEDDPNHHRVVDETATTSPGNASRRYVQTRQRRQREDWIRPVYLGVGLFLVLFAFWLLDSLKDPLLGRLTVHLERHQPTAKLVSVVTTLALVCLLEYRAAQQPESTTPPQQLRLQQERQAQQRAESSRTFWRALGHEPTVAVSRSEDDVLDGGGVWNRMDLTAAAGSSSTAAAEGVPASIFTSIGIPYCIAFGVMAYLLQFHAVATSRNNDNNNNTAWHWHMLGYLLYAAIESYGSLAVAAFWSYTNSTLSLEQAEGYYGPIIAIAQLGAIGGSTMVTIKVYDHLTLVVVACLVMILHLVVMHLYTQRFAPTPLMPSLRLARSPSPQKKQKPTKRQKEEQQQNLASRRRETAADHQPPQHLPWLTGIYLILQHNYVLLILGASCLYEVSLTCLNYQMTLLGWDRHESSGGGDDGMAFTRFMGRYGQLVNVSSLVLSSIVFPLLMKHVGLRYTLRLFPTLLLVVNVIAFVALPGNLSVLFMGLSFLKAMTYSIHDPSTEILYLPTAPAIKFQAKFWIDVVGARIAKAFGSSINQLAGNVNRSIRVASAPSLCTALALWIVCFRAGCQFDALIDNQQVVGGDGSNRKIRADNEDEDETLERSPLLLVDEELSENEIVFERPTSPPLSLSARFSAPFLVQDSDYESNS